MFGERFLSAAWNSFQRFLRCILKSSLICFVFVVKKLIDDHDSPIAPDGKEDDAQLKSDEPTARQTARQTSADSEMPTRPNPGRANGGSSRADRGPAVGYKKKRKTVKPSGGYFAPDAKTEQRITKLLDGINNNNLRRTSEEIWSVAKRESLRWFANFIVTKRVGGRDPYTQTLYTSLVKNIHCPFLVDLMTNETVKNLKMFGPNDPWVTYVTKVVLEIREKPDISLLFHRAEVESLYTKLLAKRAEREKPRGYERK